MTLIHRMNWRKVEGTTPPCIKNHTATLVDNRLVVFGGYDGRRNHATVHIFDCESYIWSECVDIGGQPPEGRNGHTATLAERKIFIIGGWLGAGPLAAKDVHCLEVDRLSWCQPNIEGEAPGPMNMHTADFFPHLRKIIVFRGGDGKAYLNDLHGLDIDLLRWTGVISTSGRAPIERANHSSVVMGKLLYIFGGWNGARRLNDVSILDTNSMSWSSPVLDTARNGLPHPRAGMTFTRLGNLIYLFGGSGPGAKCFDDLQVFDSTAQSWIPVSFISNSANQNNAETPSSSSSNNRQWHAGSAFVSSDFGNPNDDGRMPSPGIDRTRSIDQSIEFIYDDCYTSVLTSGDRPSRRAGHTSAACGTRLFVFGGSCGSDYLSGLFVLETDPTPIVAVTSSSSLDNLASNLAFYANRSEFSDVTFIVQGKPVYGHRLVLSSLSERFRAMFRNSNSTADWKYRTPKYQTDTNGDNYTSGNYCFREASEREIVVRDYSHAVFSKFIEYLYTGKINYSEETHINFAESNQTMNVDVLQNTTRTKTQRGAMGSEEYEFYLELLQLADEYMIDHLKELCEVQLYQALLFDGDEIRTTSEDKSSLLSKPRLLRASSLYSSTVDLQEDSGFSASATGVHENTIALSLHTTNRTFCCPNKDCKNEYVTLSSQGQQIHSQAQELVSSSPLSTSSTQRGQSSLLKQSLRRKSSCKFEKNQVTALLQAELLLEMSERTNAVQLGAACRYFLRRQRLQHGY